MKEGGIYLSVILAAQRGNAEFIVEAVRVSLSNLWIRDSKRRTIFFVAVRYRQVKVFNLIYGTILKDIIANIIDNEGNYLLHMAGMLPPSTYLNQISGAVLQMQRELQWFKEVESIMPPMRTKDCSNNVGMTARELFTENHKELVKEGERWTKETASSCTVVAALVATMTFAAAFTVPGGNDQNGYPIFLQKKLFLLFIISDAVSLFSSSTSVLTFLGLLTSRYAEDDFLKLLPTKLIIGLSTLFISTATMMVAFCAALFIVLHNKLWIAIPVTLLAIAQVTLFIWLQFPLLVEIIMSTFGPGIFDKNIKPWL